MWIQPTYQQTLRIKTLRCLHHRYIIISEPITGSRWWQLETLTLLTSDLPWLNQIFSEIIIYRYMFASFNVELQVFSMMMHSYLHHTMIPWTVTTYWCQAHDRSKIKNKWLKFKSKSHAYTHTHILYAHTFTPTHLRPLLPFKTNRWQHRSICH